MYVLVFECCCIEGKSFELCFELFFFDLFVCEGIFCGVFEDIDMDILFFFGVFCGKVDVLFVVDLM